MRGVCSDHCSADQIVMLPTPVRFLHTEHAEIDSTNAALSRRASRGESIHLRALSAGVQTAGRGQRGRTWHAAAGDAMLLSVGWHFPKSRSLEGLSLAVGACVANLLRTLAADERAVVLKWPNDILLAQAGQVPTKLGGILIETLAIDRDTRAAVIGIGINFATPEISPDAVVAEVFTPFVLFAPLAPAGLHEISDITISELITALLPALAQDLTQFSVNGFAPFKPLWWSMRAYASDANQRVAVRTPDGNEIVGAMVELTSSGALVIESASGRHTLVSGQISLRPA